MSENVRGPIGETSRYLSTHLREHLVSDRTSHILRHLAYPGHCVIVFLLPLLTFVSVYFFHLSMSSQYQTHSVGNLLSRSLM